MPLTSSPKGPQLHTHATNAHLAWKACMAADAAMVEVGVQVGLATVGLLVEVAVAETRRAGPVTHRRRARRGYDVIP